MAEDTEVLDREDQEEREDAGDESDLGEFLPGELCAVDATNTRIDLDDCTEAQKACLKNLCEEVSKRDLTSYRLEVRDAWKQRYFDRGNQYLLPGKNGAWVLPRMVLMAGQSFDDHNTETNIYLAFRDTITAALTAGTPSVRFEPDNASKPADITAAEKSDGAKRLLERANDMLGLQAELSRYLWTDGRSLFYTHHVLDAQRFGWTDDDVDEELDFMVDEDAGTRGAIDVNKGRQPRSQQVIECFGALETKLTIQAKTIEDSDFVQLNREFDVSRLKTKYWQFADKIVPAVTPTASSDYVRLARVSINMGMRPSNMTNDAQTYNATESLTWVRRSFFTNASTPELKDWLHETFPQGAMIAMVGNELVEARDESIDDHWSLFHARPGDGMHRPSNGSPIVPLQEKLNDCMDLVHESFMHLIPRVWIDPSIDGDALEKTERKPGQYMKAPKKASEGRGISDLFFAEPQLQLAEGLLVYIEKLFGEFAQFLCGAFPALFGGDTKSNDTASGIAQQRDQALGRVGLTWRAIKAGYARTLRQAVQGIAEYQVGKFSGKLKDTDGKETMLEIDPNDLKGNIKCYPDTDENFPESWVAQRAVWNALRAEAQKNPVMAKIISLPKNLLTMKDKTGTPELVIPEAASEKKQLIEIKELLEGQPQPNPQFQMAQAVLQHLAGQPIPPEVLQLAKQKVQGIPPMISTVPVDELDEHAFEAAAIRTWANQDEGLKAKAENRAGFENVKLHYREHIAAAMQNAQNQPPKPPSVSINYKDLETVDAKIQALKEAGINVNPAELQKELAKQEANDQAEKAAKLAAAQHPQPAQAGGSSGQNSGGQ